MEENENIPHKNLKKFMSMEKTVVMKNTERFVVSKDELKIIKNMIGEAAQNSSTDTFLTLTDDDTKDILKIINLNQISHIV